MIKHLFCLLSIVSIVCFSESFAQTKHALVVAIGDYPENQNYKRNWSDLSSMNDVELVKKFLNSQKFDEKNITYLLEKDAVTENLIKAFDKLTSNVSSGDIVYFHFSGHGQQVVDAEKGQFKKSSQLIKDEEDNFDEALVLYNAPLEWYDGYELQDHFVDDQMNFYLTKLRKKLGGNGQVIVVIDACHSGTATRGAEELVIRGTNTICAPPNFKSTKNEKDDALGFDSDLDYTYAKDLSGLVSFFGCKAEQVNREIIDNTKKGYGSLSYYFTEAVISLKDKASYQNLFSKINESMIIKFRNEQHPVIEGDNLNALIFKGEIVVQQPYFDVHKIYGLNAVIDGGSLRGVQIGDSIGFYSNTTLNAKEGKLLFKGIVEKSDIFSSAVILNKAYTDDVLGAVKFRAFTINSVNPDNIIRLKLKISNKSARKKITSFFENEKNIQLLEKGFDYLISDTIIKEETFVKIYIGNNTTNELRGMTWRSIEEKNIFDSLKTYLVESVKTDVFRKLDFSSSSIKFDLDVYPCVQNCEQDKSQIFSEKTVVGNFQVSEGKSFKLELKNNSKQTIYINLIDIYPNNNLSWLEDGRNMQVKPNESKDFNVFVSPPFGMEQFKVICTDRPMNLSSVAQNGTSLSRGGEDNPLLNYVESTLKGTRGGKISDDLGATVKTINFEIVK
jgi:hypothetical protein